MDNITKKGMHKAIYTTIIRQSLKKYKTDDGNQPPEKGILSIHSPKQTDDK